jgi:hypothetical protein
LESFANGVNAKGLANLLINQGFDQFSGTITALLAGDEFPIR